MGPQDERSALSLTATWSRTLPLPAAAETPSSVRLRHDMFSKIGRLAARLRPPRPLRKSRFIGLVDSLHGAPDERGRVRGEVQLLLMNQDENIKARVTLDADDYRKALEAHGAGGFVTLVGTLEMTGERTRRIVDPTKFRCLNEE